MIDRTAALAAPPREWRAPSVFGSPGRRMAFWLIVAAYLVWAIGDLNVNWDESSGASRARSTSSSG